MHETQAIFNTLSASKDQASSLCYTRDLDIKTKETQARGHDQMVDLVAGSQERLTRVWSEPRIQRSRNDLPQKATESPLKKKQSSKLLLAADQEHKFLEAIFNNVISNVKKKCDLKEKKRVTGLLGLLQAKPKSKAIEIRQNQKVEPILQGPLDLEENKDFLQTTKVARQERDSLLQEDSPRFKSMNADGDDDALKQTMARNSKTKVQLFKSNAISTRETIFRSTIDIQETEPKLNFGTLRFKQQKN